MPATAAPGHVLAQPWEKLGFTRVVESGPIPTVGLLEEESVPDGYRLLPRAWMRAWDAYLAVWVPLARAWAWVWHRRRLREYDAMMDRWLGGRE